MQADAPKFVTARRRTALADALGAPSGAIGTAGEVGSPPRDASNEPMLAPILSAAETSATADFIASCQQADGLILWFEGGHADPWNHVESAMALAAAGRRTEAEAAYSWLAANQHAAGSWHNYYTADGIKDLKVDTNCCAYVAVGVWHHWLATADRGFAEAMWPVVERALDFVIGLRTASGHIPWAVHADGTPWPYALLTGSSSIAHSLRCGVALAEVLGRRRPAWARTAARTERRIRHQPESFEPKDRWAMDWYYPVLCGALSGSQARAHLAAGAPKFLLGNHGVRCVADQPWVTAAETCECALAYLRAGDEAAARRLISAASALRTPDGAYYTGLVVPQDKTFPHDETSSYTAAAVLLAADATEGHTPAAHALTTAPERQIATFSEAEPVGEAVARAAREPNRMRIGNKSG